MDGEKQKLKNRTGSTIKPFGKGKPFEKENPWKFGFEYNLKESSAQFWWEKNIFAGDWLLYTIWEWHVAVFNIEYWVPIWEGLCAWFCAVGSILMRFGCILVCFRYILICFM